MWVVYAIVLHSRINPSIRGRKVAILSIVGCVLMVGTLVALNLTRREAAIDAAASPAWAESRYRSARGAREDCV